MKIDLPWAGERIKKLFSQKVWWHGVNDQGTLFMKGVIIYIWNLKQVKDGLY